jgi:capsular polysaccharide biosynthesis protein
MDNGRNMGNRVMPEERPLLAPVSQLETAGAPRVTVTTAFRRHWWLVLISVALLATIALAIGLTRTPVYTAETTLSVGRVSDTSAASLTGFTTAARGIADTYSRSIGSSEIIEPAAKQLDLDPAAVEGQVSATPVPESSVISLRAESSSPEGAVLIANKVGDSLVSYSKRVANSERETEALLGRYEAAVRQLERKRQAAQTAAESFASLESQSAADDLARAQAAKQGAQARANGLQAAYQGAQEAGGSAAIADVIERANSTTSDRTSYLGLLLVIAVVAGLAIGLSLALLRANLQARRLLT